MLKNPQETADLLKFIEKHPFLCSVSRLSSIIEHSAVFEIKWNEVE